MAGNIFSGHYGRRSNGPYLDQMPRLSAAQAAGNLSEAGSCSLFVPFDGAVRPVRVVRVRIGAMNQYRFICEQCGRRCRILYLKTLPGCRRCTGARYRSQSESSATRLRRQAYKFLNTAKLDPVDPQQKIPSRHWTTHWRVLQAVGRAIGIIVERNDRIMDLLRDNQATTDVKKKA